MFIWQNTVIWLILWDNDVVESAYMCIFRCCRPLLYHYILVKFRFLNLGLSPPSPKPTPVSRSETCLDCICLMSRKSSGRHSRLVQFAWIPMDCMDLHGFKRSLQSVSSFQKGFPNRFHCSYVPVEYSHELALPVWILFWEPPFESFQWRWFW